MYGCCCYMFRSEESFRGIKSSTGTYKAAEISDCDELLCKLASALAKIIDWKTGPLC